MAASRRILVNSFFAACLIGIGGQAWGAPMVFFNALDQGGGLFQYNLSLDNRSGGVTLAGLNVLNANSVFGVDPSTVIGAPADWSFIAPFPPFVDDLDYLALTTSANVLPGAFMTGFSFQSTLDPSVVRFSGFAVEAIDASTSSQIQLAAAQFVPEPPALPLWAAGCAGLFFAGLTASRARPAFRPGLRLLRGR